VDRSGQFRKAAANCVALARRTSDPVARAKLLTMAQRWYEMAKPVAQQQQQIQPKKEDK